jgi:cbb3-type cytochrome oxidase subunit 3
METLINELVTFGIIAMTVIFLAILTRKLEKKYKK